MSLRAYADRLKRVNLRQLVAASMQQEDGRIIEAQQTQLLTGLDGRGKIIPQYRDDEYAREKHLQNPEPGLGVPDLKLTGAFYSRFYLQANPQTFTIGSNDSKSTQLEAKYGRLIFGLQPSTAAYIRNQIVRPDVVASIRRITRS